MSSMKHHFSLFTLSNPLLLSIPLHKYQHHKPHWRSEHPVLMPLADLRSETKHAPTGDAGSLAQSESGIQQKLSFLFPLLLGFKSLSIPQNLSSSAAFLQRGFF